MFFDDELRRRIDDAIERMKALLGQLESDALSWDDFKAAMVDLMYQAYFNAATLANGGDLNEQQSELVFSALFEQLLPDEGPSEFSLENKFAEFEAQLITLGLFTASLMLYLRSSRTAALSVWRDNNAQRYGYRKLGATDNHCIECIALSYVGTQRIEDLVLPGRECRCGPNCVCTIEYA